MARLSPQKIPPGRLTCLMAAALCAVPVLAAERVDIPGYEARAGAQYRYRVQKTTETDMSSWPGAPVAAPVVMRGDFLLSATVLTRDEAGLRMRWDLSADLPADATGGAGAYPLNALYGGTLAAYGLRQLEIDTDPTGTPTAVPGADAIIATLERTLAATGPGGAVAPPDSAARRALATIKANPLAIVGVLAPESATLALAQSSQASAFAIGQEWTVPGSEDIRGVRIATATTWRLDAYDPASRRATFSARLAYDQDAFRQSQRATIDAMVATLGERAKSLTDAQWARIRDAEKQRAMRFVISTRDGATVEALENMTISVGGMTMTSAWHVWRDDQPPLLPAPPAWSAAAPDGQGPGAQPATGR